MQAATETIRELMNRYDEFKSRWDTFNGGSEAKFHEWFTEQVQLVQYRERANSR